MSETITDTCEHRDCDGHLIEWGFDPALPPHVTRFECDACGEWYLHDAEAGRLTIDS